MMIDRRWQRYSSSSVCDVDYSINGMKSTPCPVFTVNQVGKIV